MAFPLRTSHILARALIGGVGAYMYGGSVLQSGQGPIDPEAPARATDTASGDPELFAIRARDFSATDRANALVMRGRTEADASVMISAETGGRVVEIAVREGDMVSEGDLLCRLDEAARQASVQQAAAAVAQTQIDLSSAQSLADNGFTAENRVLALQAAHDGALSVLEQAELDLERTTITAPVDGLVQLPLADVGTQLAPGQLCATLLDTDPLIITGQVSERDISALAVGMAASGSLVTGESVDGTVSYISATADDATRTFRVDVEVPNPDGTLLSGITAEASIDLPPTRGHLLPLSVLKLDDEGAIGISLVDENDRIAFAPVTILGDEGAGVWVGGLPDDARVVVVGQDYVENGQTVAVTLVEDGLLQTSQAPAATLSEEGAAQ
ncbi:MAG: efflux RND transporter periplasmic adaptor subunit [Pseudomonadota bacterium]